MPTNTSKDPLNVDTFDVSCLTTGKPQDFADYSFVKLPLLYDYPDTTNDNVVVMLQGIKVRKAFPPFKSKDGSVARYPKVFVLFELANEKQLDLINSILNYADEVVFKNRSNLKGLTQFDTLEELREAEKQNREFVFRNEDDPMVIGISFPLEGFAASDDKQVVKIVYRDTENKPMPNVLQSGNIDEVLPRDSVCDVFFHPQTIKVAYQGAYNVIPSIYSQVNVMKYATPSQSSVSQKINGVKCNDFDVDNIVLGKRDPDEKRRIKPKLKYTNSKGEEKLRAISLNLTDADVFLSRRENTDNNTGEVTYSWTLAANIDAEQAEVVESIESKLYEDFIANSKELTGKKRTKKGHPMGSDKAACFKVSLREPNEKSDKHTLWLGVFVKNQGDEVPDFCNNFYKPGSKDETYTNEEVMKIINKQRHTGVDLNIYVKHIWYIQNGEAQTVKWALGNATIDPSNIGGDFNTGDTTSVYNDVVAGTEMGGKNSAFTNVTANQGDDDEDEDVDAAEDSSDPEDED